MCRVPAVLMMTMMISPSLEVLGTFYDFISFISLFSRRRANQPKMSNSPMSNRFGCG